MPELGPKQPTEFVPSFQPELEATPIEQYVAQFDNVEVTFRGVTAPFGVLKRLCPIPEDQMDPAKKAEWSIRILDEAGIDVPEEFKPNPVNEIKEEPEPTQKKTEKSELRVAQVPVKSADEMQPSPELAQVVAPKEKNITETALSKSNDVPEAMPRDIHEEIHEYQQSQEEVHVSKEVNVVDVIETKEAASQTESSVKMAKTEAAQEDRAEQMEFATEPAAPFGEEIVDEVFSTDVEELIELPYDPVDESVELSPELFGETTEITDQVPENTETVASSEALEFADISPEVTKLIVTLVAIDAETSAESLETEPSPINALVVERIMKLEGEQKEIAEELVGELMQCIESFDIFTEAEVQQAQHAEMEELVHALFESLGITATEEEVNAFIGRLLKVQLMQQSKPTGVLTDLHDPGTYERRQYFAQARKNVASFFELPRHLKLGKFTLAIHNIEIVPGTA